MFLSVEFNIIFERGAVGSNFSVQNFKSCMRSLQCNWNIEHNSTFLYRIEKKKHWPIWSVAGLTGWRLTSRQQPFIYVNKE
jgi:hypothetical protein